MDDEPRILEGLKRLLRPCRNEWEVSFAESGEEALRVLGTSSFDVIVTDMRMPGMDGAARLLAQVQARHPSVIRIVLSGYFDAEAALRAAPVAHQFLLKPCNIDKLRQAISEALSVSQILSDPGVRRAVTAVGALPAIPRTCEALIHELQRPDGSEERVRDIVQNDVGVAAKILQLANSATGRDGTQVGSIEAAVSLLGLDALRYLLISVELFQTFQPGDGSAALSLTDFQRHSRLTALVARNIPFREAIRPQCELVAFLHDVGKLVMASRFAKEWEASLDESGRCGSPLHEVEERLVGVNHAQVGAYLLGLWGLAPEVVTAVSRHHDKERRLCQRIEDADLGDAVTIANALVHQCAPSASGASSASREYYRQFTSLLPNEAELLDFAAALIARDGGSSF